MPDAGDFTHSNGNLISVIVSITRLYLGKVGLAIVKQLFLEELKESISD